MQFVEIGGVVKDLDILSQLHEKVGTYVVLVNDAITHGQRVVYAVQGAFRKIRKLWESTTGSQQGEVYAYCNLPGIGNIWQGVVWKKKPTFNGQ